MLSIVTSRGLFGAQPDQDEAYVWFRRSVLADYISPERHFPNEPLLQFDNLSAEKKAQLNEQASGPWIGICDKYEATQSATLGATEAAAASQSGEAAPSSDGCVWNAQEYRYQCW